VRWSHQFVRFLIAGGIAAAVNVGSRVVYDRWTSYSVAIVLAYLTGMVTAFLIARAYVFPKGKNSLLRSAVFFSLINVAAVLQTLLVSLGLSRYVLPALGVQSFVPEIAHMVGVAVPILTSYLGHREWSFR
jgi:putative flippase GtrA